MLLAFNFSLCFAGPDLVDCTHGRSTPFLFPWPTLSLPHIDPLGSYRPPRSSYPGNQRTRHKAETKYNVTLQECTFHPNHYSYSLPLSLTLILVRYVDVHSAATNGNVGLIKYAPLTRATYKFRP